MRGPRIGRIQSRILRSEQLTSRCSCIPPTYTETYYKNKSRGSATHPPSSSPVWTQPRTDKASQSWCRCLKECFQPFLTEQYASIWSGIALQQPEATSHCWRFPPRYYSVHKLYSWRQDTYLLPIIRTELVYNQPPLTITTVQVQYSLKYTLEVLQESKPPLLLSQFPKFLDLLILHRNISY
jgi:hypothetical protein